MLFNRTTCCGQLMKCGEIILLYLYITTNKIPVCPWQIRIKLTHENYWQRAKALNLTHTALGHLYFLIPQMSSAIWGSKLLKEKMQKYKDYIILALINWTPYPLTLDASKTFYQLKCVQSFSFLILKRRQIKLS